MKYSNFFHIEDNTFIANNGIIGSAYILKLPQKYSLSEDDFDLLCDSWIKTFSMLESAIILKSDFFLNEKFDTSSFSCLNYLQEATKEHFKDRKYLSHISYLFVMKADFDTYINAKWYNPFKSVKEYEFENFTSNQLSFFNETKNAINFLSERKFSQGQQIEIQKMSKEDLISYENLFFSGLSKGFNTNIFTDNNKVYTGDKNIGIFTINHEQNLPSSLKTCITDNKLSSSNYKFYKNYGDNFSFNLEFNHIYNQILFIDPPQRTINELEETKNTLFRNRSWNTQNENASKQTAEILNDLISNDERRVIRGTNNIIIFEEDLKEFEKQKEIIISAFNDIDIKPFYSSKTDRIKSDFFLSFPTYTPFLNNKQLYKLPLDCACTLFINNTHYKEDKEGLIFTSRVQNVPVIVDNYFADKKYENARNSIIIAPTGHGKSVLVNHLVRNYYENGDKIVILDYGGSYKKFHLFYENDVSYITYEENKPLGFNIFDIAYSQDQNNYSNLSSQNLNRIANYIYIHTGLDQIAEEELEILKKILIAYFKDSNDNPNFHSFYRFLSFNKGTILRDLNIGKGYFDIEKFLLLIERFSETGSYSFMYSESDYDIVEETNKRITIFEFENASNDKIILSLLLYLSDVIIDNNILKDTSIRGHIIFDEIAKMYKFDGIIEKVELHYQTVRKKEGEITQVLQTIHQLPTSTAGKSIVENTQVLYVLNAKNYEPIKEAFNLSNHAIYQMQSLQSKLSGEPPFYTEIFIMRGKNHSVFRLELPKEVFWAYQTDGSKNLELMNEYESTGDMQKAITNIIKRQEDEKD